MEAMEILETTLAANRLREIAENYFGDLIKAVVDVRRELIAIDAELHSDLESLLLDHGSAQQDLWRINRYPDVSGEDFVEFDSMINVRPSNGNITRVVDDERRRETIRAIVDKWIER